MAKTSTKSSARKTSVKSAPRKTSARKTSARPVPPIIEEVRAPRGSVVAMAFKQRYAEKGRPQDSGDWLALQLDEVLPKPINLDQMYALAEANGLDAKGRWSHLNPGQQRMLLGQVLRPMVGTVGKLVVPGERKHRVAPRSFCDKHGH